MSKDKDELKTWFLGTNGESAPRLRDLAELVITRASNWRSGKAPVIHDNKHGKLEERLIQLLDYLRDRTVPAYSSRYQAHMGWDLLMPGILGHLVGLLFPANNVAYEGSPGTTPLEMLVTRDLCRMLGFETRNGIEPWGHLVGGGTIGNIEALWAARNLKFLPLALKAVLTTDDRFKAVGGQLGLTDKKLLVEVDDWALLNVPIDRALALPGKATKLVEEQLRDDFANALNAASINGKGIYPFLQAGINPPKIFLSHDNHYSLEKAAALLGLGQDSLRFVTVDKRGRMNLDELNVELKACAEARIPVIAVVANLGSTELGAVDPLHGILEIREGLLGRLDFMVHVDASFGGYHASLLHDELDFGWHFGGSSQGIPLKVSAAKAADKVPEIGLSDRVKREYEALKLADSVAVDPHKLGFLPYPGGAICYRNSALRDLTKFSAPYLGAVVPQGIAQVQDQTEQFLGVFGVEGSRPGGASAAAFLSHSLLRPTKTGYGRLSGKELFATKRVLAALCSLNAEEAPFRVAVAGEYGADDEAALAELARKTDGEINDSEGDKELLRRCGPDLNLLCYLLNFKRGGEWNQELLWVNVYNLLIYNQLSLRPGEQTDQKLIVARTIFAGREGTEFIEGMLSRLHVKDAGDLRLASLVALRSSEWNPWLTEEDPQLDTFREALRNAAMNAHHTIAERFDELSKAAAGLAGALDGFVLAMGILGALAAPRTGTTTETEVKNPILTSLGKMKDGIALKGLAIEALQKFQ